MAWRLAGSLLTLRAEITAAFPTRSKVSDGSIGDPAHAARKSDHNPDAGGVVRAIDVTEWDPDPRVTDDDVAFTLCEFLRAVKDPRTKYVISRGRMFSSYKTSTREPWEWGPCSGANGHFHHAHISVQPGALGDDDRLWGFTGQPTIDTGELTVAQYEELKDAIAAVAAKVDDLHEQWIGNQEEARDETLRQLLKVVGDRTKEIVIDTRELTKSD